MSFFLSKYIPGSSFDYLPSFYTPYTDQEEQLSASIRAVALASLSNELESLEIFKEARKCYVHAIQATNTALQDPIRAKKDSTLLTVILLSLYEVIICTTQPTLCLWESHINGAMALIRLRGRQQMQSQLSLKLLSQATSSAVISAHRNMAEVPMETISLVTHGLQYASKNDLSWSFKLISFRSANLHAAIKDGRLSDPDLIVAAAMKLDHELVAFSKTLPPSWRFEVHFVKEADPTLVYEGCYHLYPNHYIAQGLNAWRLSRLQLNEMIWKQILRQRTSPLCPQDYATLMRQVESTVIGLCSEICYSVPQYVELPAALPVSVCTVQSLSSTTSRALLPMIESSASGFTHSARGYGIICPLMTVADCVIPDSPRRTWVTNRLQYISRYLKNPQALLALEILEGKREPEKR